MGREIRPDRVAIYIRWSTDDQAEGTTMEVQREACRAYVVSQGWQVRDDLVFVDEGLSGGSLKRPALTRLRQLIKEDQVDCVVVFKLDRLSRSVVDTVNLVLREWEGHTYIKSAREPVDTTTAIGKQFFYMLVSYAEWERNVIRERTQSGKLKRLQEGKNPGFKPPYGYIRGATPGTFAVVEHEAGVVRRIYDMYLTGLGYQSIAFSLNDGGIAFRGGRPFSQETVKEILANRLYVGEIVYRKKVANPRRHTDEQAPRQVRNSQPPFTVKNPAIPAIIPDEVWDGAAALRESRASNRSPRRALTSDHLLTGIARCLKCGHALIGRKANPGPGAPSRCRQQYYMCAGKRLKGTGFCDCGYIRQDELDAWIVERLKERYGGELGQQHYLADVDADLRRELEQVQASLEEMQRADWALKRELEVLARDYRRELLPYDEYREQRSQVDRELAQLAGRIRAAERQMELHQQQAAARKSSAVLVHKVPLWDSLTQAAKKHLLRELVAILGVYKPLRGYDLQYDLTWVSAVEPGAWTADHIG